jgi:hypothetical protein
MEKDDADDDKEERDSDCGGVMWAANMFTISTQILEAVPELTLLLLLLLLLSPPPPPPLRLYLSSTSPLQPHRRVTHSLAAPPPNPAASAPLPPLPSERSLTVKPVTAAPHTLSGKEEEEEELEVEVAAAAAAAAAFAAG